MDQPVGERMGVDYLLEQLKMKTKHMPNSPHSNNPKHARDASIYVAGESSKPFCKGWQYLFQRA